MNSEAEWDGALLKSLHPGWAERIIFFEECQSTNDEAKRMAQSGLKPGSVILAERQTEGRGRRGQRWACPPGESIACSVLLRPSDPVALWSRLSLAAGLAVAEGLDRFGVSAEVKWPNDVWVREQKICGILVESVADFVVIGIGVNVNTTTFPEGLAHPATSLALETGEKASREEVLIAFLDRLELRVGQIASGFSELLEAWNERCVLRGRRVSLETGGSLVEGRMEGLSPSGELLLRTSAGLEKILHADHIRLAGTTLTNR